MNVISASAANEVSFIEVDGELRAPHDARWIKLLRDIVESRAHGLGVDLRGCSHIDQHCLEALLAAAVTLRLNGGTGVAVVTLPGSDLRRRIEHFGDGQLPSYDSARAAIRALVPKRS